MALIIYNRGSRLFKHHGIVFVPNRKTPVPEEREESGRKLLADYPDELIEAGSGPADPGATREIVAAKDREIATLREQNEKLRRLAEASATEEDVSNALEENARLAGFVESSAKELESAGNRIRELEQQLSGALEKLSAPAEVEAKATPNPKKKH